MGKKDKKTSKVVVDWVLVIGLVILLAIGGWFLYMHFSAPTPYTLSPAEAAMVAQYEASLPRSVPSYEDLSFAAAPSGVEDLF